MESLQPCRLGSAAATSPPDTGASMQSAPSLLIFFAVAGQIQASGLDCPRYLRRNGICRFVGRFSSVSKPRPSTFRAPQ